MTTPGRYQLTMPIPGNALVRLIPDYYTQHLGLPYYVPCDDSHFSAAPMVWGSWTSCYDDVCEADIVRNTDWIADHLKPYGFQYVELDDGYDAKGRHGHNWIDQWNRNKFPHGPQWLAGYIKSKGLHPGIWIVPNAYGGSVDEHPDWYLRDKSGKLVLDYGTPALDSTNPQVQAFVKKMFATLGQWGFEYYKFDGEHALPKYAPPVNRNKLFDPSLDPLTAYRDRLKLIRETIGPKVFLEGCPAGTPLNGIGYFNSYFNGSDVYNNWNGMQAFVDSINSNAFLNHIAVYVMPGEGMELGPRMTVAEASRGTATNRHGHGPPTRRADDRLWCDDSRSPHVGELHRVDGCRLLAGQRAARTAERTDPAHNRRRCPPCRSSRRTSSAAATRWNGPPSSTSAPTT